MKKIPFETSVKLWLDSYGAPHTLLNHPLVKQCVADRDAADTHKYILKYASTKIDWTTYQKMCTNEALRELMVLAK